MEASKMASVFEIITGKILSHLDNGVIPWRKPWSGKAGIPRNLVTGKPYKGINLFLLMSECYSSPCWLTFKQVQDKGGSIKKGEKSSLVIFWKFLEIEEVNKETSDPEKKKIPMLRYYRIFNVLQTEGMVYPQPLVSINSLDPIAQAEALVEAYKDKPEIKHGFTKACYRPSEDLIKMPLLNSFISQEEYYSTLFHECVHSTGSEKRLDRSTLTESQGFGSESYAQEELVAEMGAAYLCGISGISQATIENSASYIKGWRDTIAKDPKLVIIAAAQAQKAVSWITGESLIEEEKEEI
jgi:antirestriction protein ArdC